MQNLVENVNNRAAGASKSPDTMEDDESEKKRLPNRRSFTEEHKTLTEMAEESERMLAAKRAARAEARRLRQEERLRQREGDASGAGSADMSSSERLVVRREQRSMRSFSSNGSSESALSSRADSMSNIDVPDAENATKYNDVLRCNAELQSQKDAMFFELNIFKDRFGELEEDLAECKAALRRSQQETRDLAHDHAQLQQLFHERSPAPDTAPEGRASHSTSVSVGTASTQCATIGAQTVAPATVSTSSSMTPHSSPGKAVGASETDLAALKAEAEAAAKKDMALQFAALEAVVERERAAKLAMEDKVNALEAKVKDLGSADDRGTATPDSVLGDEIELENIDDVAAARIKRLSAQCKRLTLQKEAAEEAEDDAQREMRKSVREGRRLQSKVDQLEMELASVQDAYERLRERRALREDSDP
eukprot:m.1429688 g.1429688  ORF g.1429688 m.1429688 type:complete len:422 (-) comp25069_c0_seq51:4630-5895(-)